MNILLTGATGFIGQKLGQKLVSEGHTLKVLTRNKSRALKKLYFPADFVEIDLMTEELPEIEFKNIDAVIHLLGESVDGRWTNIKKKLILDSRNLSLIQFRLKMIL